MSTLPSVANALKIKLGWTIEADPMGMTGFYVRYSGGPPTSAQCVTMAANIASSAATAFQALAHTRTTLNSVTVTDLSSMSGGVGVGGAPWTGTRAGGANPVGTAVVVNFGIARRYRGGKPRVYLPLLDSSDLATSGLWISANAGSVATAWNSFIGAVEADGVGCTITSQINISYYLGFTNVPYGAPTKYRRVPTQRVTPVQDVVTGASASLFVGSQRRRNRNA